MNEHEYNFRYTVTPKPNPNWREEVFAKRQRYWRDTIVPQSWFGELMFKIGYGFDRMRFRVKNANQHNHESR